MGLSDELWAGVESIWETVVTHSSVTEMAGGFLDRERSHVYFDEDYPFLRYWAIPLSLATAKAPDSGAARGLVRFLHLGLGGEEGLFKEAFRKRGISRKAVAGLQYLRTTQNYSGYLRTLAYEGTFTEVVATLLAVEWPYLTWAQPAEEIGRKPSGRYYQTWIDIHTSPGMSRFMSWLRSLVDESAPTAVQQDRLQEIF